MAIQNSSSEIIYIPKEIKGKETSMKADRKILQRLIIAYHAGRNVDLHRVLQHELMTVPVALAYTNGSLRVGNKTVLTYVMTKDVTCPTEITLDGTSCLVIDGQALVVVLGKPSGVTHFVSNTGRSFNRNEVTFDRYRETSIKAATRKKRSKHARPVRRVVEDSSVPIPNNWNDFLAVPANKADLADFLSKHLITNAPPGKTLVVAGGFHRGPSMDI